VDGLTKEARVVKQILGSDSRREISTAHKGIGRDRVLHPDYPFVILREASAEEWAAQRRPHQGFDPNTSRTAATGSDTSDYETRRLYFHEIRTD
jgi:hypothetical protein